MTTFDLLWFAGWFVVGMCLGRLVVNAMGGSQDE